MRTMRLSEHACEGTPEFQDGIECVLYIRCMEHRAASQLNMAESNDSECGECIRQQCWKDIKALVKVAIENTLPSDSGELALKTLLGVLDDCGIGTFGMSDELEEAQNGANHSQSGNELCGEGPKALADGQ